MSLFDYPRVNIKGTVTFSPGTANNSDYSADYQFPASDPNAGQPFSLIDSKLVEAETFGKSDEEFVDWVQHAQEFDSSTGGNPRSIMPSEWNYYGDMDMSIGSASVVGVQTDADNIYTAVTDGVPLTDVIGASLSLSGWITDVNSEGSPPATQFFLNTLQVGSGGSSLSSNESSTSKAASQWLNFYRNVNRTADGGAGGYVYHVVLKDKGANVSIIDPDSDPNIIGAIVRYYLGRAIPKIDPNDYPTEEEYNNAVEASYASQETNPTTLEIVCTIAPLYAQETIYTTPVGRLMISNEANISTGSLTNNNGGGTIALGPAVAQVSADSAQVSVDFVGTFPDYYQSATNNDKYDFGTVKLFLSNVEVATVNYADTPAGDAIGWIFDFPLSDEAQALLPDADFKLIRDSDSLPVLQETGYYIVTNQQAIYAEQNLAGGTTQDFLNQGLPYEPATLSVYHRGVEQPDIDINLYQYPSTPLETPPNKPKEELPTIKPGDAISVDVSQPGNFLFTFTIPGDSSTYPLPPLPSEYKDFAGPPWITNSPAISLRILPNPEDFSQYYENPTAAEPVANDDLEFDFLYEKVLKVYYLLYPTMKPILDLSSETEMTQSWALQNTLETTDLANWMLRRYMPRTRDLSESRAKLLQAWCRREQNKQKSQSDPKQPGGQSKPGGQGEPEAATPDKNLSTLFIIGFILFAVAFLILQTLK